MHTKKFTLILSCILVWMALLQIRRINAQTGDGSAVALNDEELERLEKERTKNVVRLAATDQLNSEIITNRTRAYLSCESGEMIVKINFSQPFRGVAYSDYDRSSPCKFYGDGSRYYEMRLPLKGCGTKQEAPRLFINNIIFRFHRSLELEEDEIKTIICRYPPPLAPPPPNIVAPILEPTAPVPVIVPAKLSEIELLLIICALLFLTLLLLGIGIAYYCLKRRNIKIVKKKKAISTAPPSIITKVSQSTLFDQIRIPRATAHSTESSETIPSDYPSSDSDERRTIISETSTVRNDNYKYENSAFIPEPYPMDIEREDSISNVPIAVAHKPVITKQEFLTTILETENITEENVLNTTHKVKSAKAYKKLGSSPPKPPSIPDNDNRSDLEIVETVPMRTASIAPPKLSMANVNEIYIDTQETTDLDENTTRNRIIVYPPPKITMHKIDDYFVTNISEVLTTEHVVKEAKDDHNTQLGPYPKSLPVEPRPGPTPDILRSITNEPSSRHRVVEPTREIIDTYSEHTTDINDESRRSYLRSRSNTRPNEPVLRRVTRPEIITRVLDRPPLITGIEEITIEDKRKWRTIITTDEVFRSLVIESTTYEECIRISRDIRYESLFDQRKWEIIIKILTHPDVINPPPEIINTTDRKYQKYNRRKGYMPSGPEGDPTLPRAQSRPDSMVSRRTSRSGSGADYDLRSLTEEDVIFARRQSYFSPDQAFMIKSSRSVPEFIDNVPIMPSGHHHQYVERSTNISEFVSPPTIPYFQNQPPESSSDLHALSLAVDDPQLGYEHTTYQTGGYNYGNAVYESSATQEVYMGTSNSRRLPRRTSTVGDREESKSITETDIYDWLRR